jgi:uncharacterized membrane protein
MFPIIGSITINRPPEQVYGFLADLQNIPKWEGEVLEVKVLTEGPIRLGTKFTEKVKMPMKTFTAQCEVTGLDPQKRMAFRAVSPFMQYEGEYRVSPAEQGTLVEVDAKASFSGFWKLMEGMFKGEIMKEVQTKLGTLKSVIEQS